MNRFVALLILAFVSILLAGCDTEQGEEKVLILGPNQVPCVQGSAEPCYLIKNERSDPWRVANATIQKLDPIEGYEYTILVRESGEPTEDPYDIPKVTFLVVDVIEEREVSGRIKWYYG